MSLCFLFRLVKINLILQVLRDLVNFRPWFITLPHIADRSYLPCTRIRWSEGIQKKGSKVRGNLINFSSSNKMLYLRPYKLIETSA